MDIEAYIVTDDDGRVIVYEAGTDVILQVYYENDVESAEGWVAFNNFVLVEDPHGTSSD